ncbi:hypothetical protein M9H77_22672 [Catharanthus roseus]|uniref:Uncharacterized protein n=1 Tax=Catharanthus roseus TaxID=4058 RepID=A0ACC0AS29_CATRO|nr:hypothetical protein M9H77_22672 [Catharanthus roseus]
MSLFSFEHLHSFNKQSACEKSITEIIKEHFVEANATVENGRGICTIRVAKYHELKANAARLHIETCSPILIDEQLMFETVGVKNKGYLYSFGSQFAAITTER